MFLIFWAIAIAFAVADEIVVSRLLRIQYVKFRSEWEQDGKPRGVLWIPDEARIGRWYITYASGHAGQLARWRWMLGTPEWAAKTETAGLLLTLHRIFLPAFLLCLIGPFLIAVFTQWRA
jgi:hypothetical protein